MPATSRTATATAGILPEICSGELFSGLFVVGFANGILGRVHSSVLTNGWLTSVFSTFDISILAWLAFWICPTTILKARRQPPTRLDWVVAGSALFIFALPLEPLAWIALTGIGLYLLRGVRAGRCDAPSSPVHASALILLATCATMFWGRLLLSVGSGPILGADARLVGWVTGFGHAGNTVPLSDGSGFLWIAPGCSSLSGISLAFLAWVLFAQARAVSWSLTGILWCGLGILAVVGVNVLRISAMVQVPDLFDLIHGPAGATIASWVSLGLLVAICHLGTRRAVQAPV